MIAVLQRVAEASVKIDDAIYASINKGILILLGIEESDNQDDINWLANKIVNLRIFNDENGVMNVNLNDSKGELLIVSQFTLHASTKKGNRPSYIKAARPEIAIPLYKEFINTIQKLTTSSIKTGEFGANMQVTLTNDGPVTIIIDTKDKK
jgi:D-tyrosyl-tRNA(Tyr) deacylase